VLLPALRFSAWLQFAVPEPVAVPPAAATPLTVTDEIPLFPNP